MCQHIATYNFILFIVMGLGLFSFMFCELKRQTVSSKHIPVMTIPEMT